MRRIAFLFLLFPFALSAQEDCQLFTIQDLAAENLALHDSIANFAVDTIIFQPDGTFEVQLSNGTTFTRVQGCTDPAYDEYNAAANIDNGSCATISGCTDPAYVEYDATANTDDGSCAALLGCTESEFASMDGSTYDIVTIGDQCWFAENLRSTVYADGTSIPEVTDNAAWTGLSSGARCDSGNDASNVAIYGRLYNWYAVDDSRGLCPSGWHVPTDGEWTEMEDYITCQGFSGTEGTALKSTSGWAGNGNGTDDFGFSALPGGYRNNGYGNFYVPGDLGYWWSSSPNGDNARYRYLSSSDPDFYRDDFDPRLGFSVRCLRDAE